METVENQYTPAQLAKSLHISVPTLRKYSLLVERVAGNNNYFPRNQQNVRSYTDEHLTALQELVELSKQSDMTLQSAAQQLFGSENPDEKSRPNVKIVTSDLVNETVKKLQADLLVTQQKLIKLELRIAQLERQAYPQMNAEKIEKTAKVDHSYETVDKVKPAQNITTYTQVQKQNEIAHPELKFTEPLPSDDPKEAATHHLTFADEKTTGIPSVIEDKDKQVNDNQHDKEKKQSWWQKVRSGR